MPKSHTLDLLRLKLRAVEAQLDEVRTADRDLEDRRRAVVEAMIVQGETDALLVEFERIDGERRASIRSKEARLDRLIELSGSLQAQIAGAEQAIRDAASEKRRVAAVEAATATLELARVWQTAADALVEATRNLYAAHAVVSRETSVVVRERYATIELQRDRLTVIGPAARGQTGGHAAAIADVVRLLADVFDNKERMRQYVEINEYGPKSAGALMTDAALKAAQDVATFMQVPLPQ